MTHKQYETSIATGELQLNGFWEKLSHFGLVFFLLFILVIFIALTLFFFFRGDPKPFQPEELWVVFIPLVLSLLFFRIQKNKLKFEVVETSLKMEQITTIIEQVALELEWKGKFCSKQIYEAKTDPGFFSGSWGEQITILLPDNRVLVNSICDLDKRSSMVSFGRNRENEQMLITSIKNAEQILAKQPGN
jgi:hypothetical protein